MVYIPAGGIAIASNNTHDNGSEISIRTARKLIFLFLAATAGIAYVTRSGEIVLPTLSLTGWMIPIVLWIIVIAAMYMWNISDNQNPEDRSPWGPNRILELIWNA